MKKYGVGKKQSLAQNESHKIFRDVAVPMYASFWGPIGSSATRVTEEKICSGCSRLCSPGSPRSRNKTKSRGRCSCGATIFVFLFYFFAAMQSEPLGGESAAQNETVKVCIIIVLHLLPPRLASHEIPAQVFARVRPMAGTEGVDPRCPSWTLAETGFDSFPGGYVRADLLAGEISFDIPRDEASAQHCPLHCQSRPLLPSGGGNDQ